MEQPADLQEKTPGLGDCQTLRDELRDPSFSVFGDSGVDRTTPGSGPMAARRPSGFGPEAVKNTGTVL